MNKYSILTKFNDEIKENRIADDYDDGLNGLHEIVIEITENYDYQSAVDEKIELQLIEIIGEYTTNTILSIDISLLSEWCFENLDAILFTWHCLEMIDYEDTSPEEYCSPIVETIIEDLGIEKLITESVYEYYCNYIRKIMKATVNKGCDFYFLAKKIERFRNKLDKDIVQRIKNAFFLLVKAI